MVTAASPAPSRLLWAAGMVPATMSPRRPCLHSRGANHMVWCLRTVDRDLYPVPSGLNKGLLNSLPRVPFTCCHLQEGWLWGQREEMQGEMAEPPFLMLSPVLGAC